jgi:hypothetical protein
MKALTEIWRNAFTPPTAKELACRELADAQRMLLHYQSHQEFCTAMVQYESDRIARLQHYLSSN